MTKILPKVSIIEAAKILGISPDTLRRLEKRGKISIQRDTSGRRIYSQVDIEAIRRITRKSGSDSDAITIHDAAKILGVSVDSLRRWEKQGKIRGFRTPGGHRRYSLNEIDTVKDSVRKYQTHEVQNVREVTIPQQAPVQIITEVRHIEVAAPAPALYEKLHIDQKKVLFIATYIFLLFLLLTGGIKGAQTLGYLPSDNQIAKTNKQKVLAEKSRGAVLQASTGAPTFGFNIEAVFRKNAFFQGDAQVDGDLTLNGQLVTSGALTVSSLVTTGDITSGGDLIVNGGSLTTSGTTFNLINETATTLNLGGAATAVNIGSTTGTTTIKNALNVDGATTLDGSLTVSGSTTLGTTTTGALTTGAITSGAITASGDLILTDGNTINIGGSGSTGAYNIIGDSITGASASMNSDNDLYIEGNLEVDGTISGSLSSISLSGISQGATLFAGAGGVITGDDINYFWDDTNNRLGIGTATPGRDLDVAGDVTLGGAITDLITFTGRLTNGTSLIPAVNLGSDLGTSALKFNNLYVANINADAALTLSGQGIFTYDPANTTFAEASIRINPTSPSANEQLLGMGQGGEERAAFDAEGDLSIGYDGAAGSSIPVTSNPFMVYNHGTANIFSIDTSGTASFMDTTGAVAATLDTSTNLQDVTITSDTTFNIESAALSSTSSSGQAVVNVSSSSGFYPGMNVVVIQMTGTGAGNYEELVVSTTGAGTITMTGNLTNTYTVNGSSAAQVISYPRFRNLTINSNVSLTAPEWDGSTGGILYFKATGTLTNNGTITMSSKGFTGGAGGTAGSGSDNQLASGSAGFDGLPGTDGSAGTAGNAPSASNQGGTGGGGTAGGIGLYSTTTTTDTGGGGGGGSGGGAGGGVYASANAGTIGAAGGAGGNDGTGTQSPGLGGSAGSLGVAGSTYDSANSLFMGGGGSGGGGGGGGGGGAIDAISGYGAGGGDGGAGGTGGDGGGIIFINASTITNSGSILSTGDAGVGGTAGTAGTAASTTAGTSAGGGGGSGGGGGGGAGGTIWLKAPTVTVGTVTATGGTAGSAGTGGDGGACSGSQAQDAGGGGGGGNSGGALSTTNCTASSSAGSPSTSAGGAGGNGRIKCEDTDGTCTGGTASPAMVAGSAVASGPTATRGTLQIAEVAGTGTDSLSLKAGGTTAGLGGNSSILFLDADGGVKGRFETTSSTGSGVDGNIGVAASVNCQTTDISIYDGDTTADCAAINITALASAGATSITATNTNFYVGNEILIIQMSGTGAGNYETRKITGLTSTTAFVIDKPLTNSYQATGAQIVRIPNYKDVDVSSGGTLTVTAWNGTVGGILFFRASGRVTNAGSITTAALGFTGGSAGTGGGGGGAFTCNGTQQNGDTSTAGTAGGAGNGTGAGAAGGAGGSVEGGEGGGGGGGSYGGSGSTGAAGALGGTAGTGGTAGAAGSTYGDGSFSTLFLGSGGGGGGGGGGGRQGVATISCTSGASGAGGAGRAGGAGGSGGGITVIAANSIENSGTISAAGGSGAIPTLDGVSAGSSNGNGTNGAGGGSGGGTGGGGGGGSGGALWLLTPNIVQTGTVDYSGGDVVENIRFGGNGGNSTGDRGGGRGGGRMGQAGLDGGGASRNVGNGAHSPDGSGGAGGNGRYLLSSPVSANQYGTLFLGATNTSSADVAEHYPSFDALEPGEVVSLDPENGVYIRRSTKDNENNLLGIISTDPGVILGQGDLVNVATDSANTFPVALKGRVPTRIAASSPEIKIGDYLTVSRDEPGKAEKLTANGRYVGRALENWSPGTNAEKIQVFAENGVNLGSLTDLGEFDFDATIKANDYKLSIIEELKNRILGIKPSEPSTSTDSAAFDPEVATGSAVPSSLSVLDALERIVTRLENVEGDITLLKTDSLVAGSSTESGILNPVTSSNSNFDMITASDIVVTNGINVSSLSLGDGRIDAIGTLGIQNNTIEIDINGNLSIKNGVIVGNDKFRGSVKILPGQTSVVVPQNWVEIPETINISPNYNTNVWYEDKSTDGFKIKVGSTPSTEGEIDWMAIW